MKKKILSVLIAATLTLSLTACGGNGEQKAGTPEKEDCRGRSLSGAGT